MAKHRKPILPSGNIRLEGMDETAATYADVFVITTESDTNMASIYFFQSQVSAVPETRAGQLTTTQMGARQKAKCVGRVILAPKGLEILLSAMAENRGFTLTPKTEDRK